jgi:geranylgeranyl reductase family protein
VTAADRDCDVAVVGAGPGGSAAALALSRGGLRVAILEKAVLPRYKTCGGGLLGRTLDLLPLDVRAVVERECFSAELHHHGPALSFTTRRERPVVSMVMRDRFDLLLTAAAQEAGAMLLAGAPVVSVAARADGVELETKGGTVRARFAIGADGAGSVVARQCGMPDLRHVIPAMECEVTVDAARFEKFRHAARFDFGLTPHGYAWVFPKRGHLSVGVLTTRRGSCNLKDEYARYLAHLGLTGPLREERHGFMIPIRPRDGMCDTPRVLPIGDAAGLADPLLAEGISGAILSGQLAARAILENGFDDAATRCAYRAHLRAGLLPELRIARVLARLIYDFPRVRAWLLSRHGQRLSERLTRIVMGETSYRETVGEPGNWLKLLKALR